MMEAARGKLAQLHPDKGGDAAEFREFLKAYRHAQVSFKRAGIFSDDPVVRDKIARQAERGRLPNQFHDPARALAVARLIEAGRTVPEIVAALGTSDRYVLKVRKVLGVAGVCDCGRALPHKGRCSARGKHPNFTALGRRNTPEQTAARKERFKGFVPNHSPSGKARFAAALKIHARHFKRGANGRFQNGAAGNHS